MDPPAGNTAFPQQMRTPNGSKVLKIGRARGPLNLWSVEAREGMFNRREAGEEWETICPDFPNRSRHAMQQQFSMMKKQKAQADGTYVHTRRRRRKRKQKISEDTWDSYPKNPDSSSRGKGQKWMELDAEEEEGLTDSSFEEENGSIPSEGSSANEDETKSAVEQTGSSINDNVRLPMPPRSLTEPTRHGNSKIVTFSTIRSNDLMPQVGVLTSFLPINRKITAGPTQNEEESCSSMHKQKRQKLSLEPSTEITRPITSEPSMTNSTTKLTDAIFDTDAIEQFQKILQAGIERAHSQSIALEMERASIKKSFGVERDLIKETFEAAAFRSNRRVRESQDVLREATRKQAELIKEKDQELAQSIARLKSDRKQWEREQAGIMRLKEKGLAEALAKLEGERRQLEKDNSTYLEENRQLKMQLKSVEGASNKVGNLEDERKQLEQKNIVCLEEIRQLKEQLEIAEEKRSKRDHLDQIQEELEEAKIHVRLKAEQVAEREDELKGHHDLLEKVYEQVRSFQGQTDIVVNEMKVSIAYYGQLLNKIRALKDDWNKLPYNDMKSRFTDIELEAEKSFTPLAALLPWTETADDVPQKILSILEKHLKKDSVADTNGIDTKDDQEQEGDKIEVLPHKRP